MKQNLSGLIVISDSAIHLFSGSVCFSSGSEKFWSQVSPVKPGDSDISRLDTLFRRQIFIQPQGKTYRWPDLL